MSESGKSGFWSHWPALTATAAALVTAIATLIGSLAAAGVIGNGGDEGTTTDTDVHHRLSFEPTDDELRLASMVPLVHQSECERDEPLMPRTVAGFYCRPTDAAGLSYHLFESTPALNSYMNGRLSFGDRTKQCGNAASGSSTYRNSEKETVGRLVCYFDDGEAWIEWSNLEGNVYAYAFRADDDWKALFNFWTGAGPNV